MDIEFGSISIIDIQIKDIAYVPLITNNNKEKSATLYLLNYSELQGWNRLMSKTGLSVTLEIMVYH